MLDKSYVTIVESIKEQIRCAKHKAILNVNKEMLILYWNIGKIINENSTWGSKFLKNLSLEIKREFPLTKGFSVSNLKNMARFYREYSDVEIGQSVTGQITWTHNTGFTSKSIFSSFNISTKDSDNPPILPKILPK